MPGPVLWGPNNISNNLQNAELLANGTLLSYNGPKNYIGYNNFENGLTTGWALGTVGTLTNGIPTGTPNFAGSTTSLAIGVTQTNPLAGITSMQLIASAATTVGNMVASVALPIDIEDQAKVLNFKCSAVMSFGASATNQSGTSSNSFAWAVYDVTNSVWLSNTGNFSMTGSGTITGTFQTGVTTASVRICIYAANATTGAVTLQLDSFILSPNSPASTGPVMGDATAYTPTFSAGWGTPTSVATFYKRIGDECLVWGTFVAGTTAASPGTISLPSGLTINFAKLGTDLVYIAGQITTSQGTITSATPATSNGPFGLYTASTSGTNLVTFTKDTSGGSWAATNTSNLFANGYKVTFAFRVPISGWSANAVQSSDTLSQVVSWRGQNTAGTALSSGTDIPFTTSFDTTGSYSSPSFTVPVSGKYTVMSKISLTTSVSFNLVVLQNGAVASQDQGIGSIAHIFDIIDCKAGDVLKLNMAAVSGTVNLNTTANLNTFSIDRISGPAVVQATESVNARYYSSSTSVSSSLATVMYSTKGWDTHNAYNAATGIYTAPVSGKYQVNASIAMTGTFVLNSILDLQVQQTGSSTQTSESKSFSGGAVTQMNTNVGDIFYMIAGDTLKVQTSNSGGTPVIAATTTQNWLSIARVGN